MDERILYLLSVLCFFSFSACTGEEEAVLTEEQSEIWLSVVNTSEIEAITRALPGFDVRDFNVSLSHGKAVIFSFREYGNITGVSIACSAGSGYLLTTESCTENETERTNNDWGQTHLVKSTSFAIRLMEPAEITLKCALANSSINVESNDSIKKNLSNCAVTLYAIDASSCDFTFNENNYNYRTAYFNVGATRRVLRCTTSLALPGEKGPHTYSNVLILESSYGYHLTMKLDDESESKTSVGIMVDGMLVDKETPTEIINPYN